tara:strand:+ start:278 stop:709 length:432 start_codon:yes stop_codon:yes gene_type:complete
MSNHYQDSLDTQGSLDNQTNENNTKNINNNQYNLDSNYITNFNIHLQNLKNNSDSVITDLCLLENLLEEIKIYNSKGYNIDNIINSINTHNNDLKLCLNEVFNNIKLIDNKFNIQTINLKNKTNTIVKKNKKSSNLCCCFFKL